MQACEPIGCAMSCKHKCTWSHLGFILAALRSAVREREVCGCCKQSNLPLVVPGSLVSMVVVPCLFQRSLHHQSVVKQLQAASK